MLFLGLLLAAAAGALVGALFFPQLTGWLHARDEQRFTRCPHCSEVFSLKGGETVKVRTRVKAGGGLGPIGG
jgi:hypothetical protein